MPGSVTPTPHFVRGLDSFRLIAAAIVAAGHGAWVPFDRFAGETHGPWKLLAGAWDSLPNGTLAVCVFFFISGFCIHFPNVAKERVPVVPFLIKRGLRIGVPLLVILATAYACGRQYVSALDSVLWSVYCELAYYALYPVLFPIPHRRWVRATIASAAVSIGLLIIFPETSRPMNFRVSTFLFCTPIWLLGAVLAERYRSGFSTIDCRRHGCYVRRCRSAPSSRRFYFTMLRSRFLSRGRSLLSFRSATCGWRRNCSA